MTTKIDDLVTRFLTWPVPADVYPDGTPGQPGRTGTNLLTAQQAKHMLTHVLGDVLAEAEKSERRAMGAEPVGNKFASRGIAEWERIVGACSKRGYSTFMTDADDRQDRREVFATLNILARVEWSKTTRGGKQYDLLADDEPRACASSYGLCE